MHIQIDGDEQGSFDLKWRGVALGKFDGRVWSNNRAQHPLFREMDGRFVFPPPAGDPEDYSSPDFLSRVDGAGGHERFLPGRRAGESRRLLRTPGHGRRRRGFRSGSGASRQPLPDVFRHRASWRPATFVQRARPIRPTWSPAIFNCPSLTVAFRNSRNRLPLRPTTTTTRPAPWRPIFALTSATPCSSRARCPMIPWPIFSSSANRDTANTSPRRWRSCCAPWEFPSRVVNGFRTGEFNDLTSQYVVRASNAHSWVEAYFPNYGWVTFDPTPGASFPARTGWSRVIVVRRRHGVILAGVDREL